MIYEIEITPIPAPRLNYKSRFNPAKVVLWQRYMAYKTELASKARAIPFNAEKGFGITFILPMPKTMKGKGREDMINHPHLRRPDLKNLLSAFEDAIWADDSKLWHYTHLKKIWGEHGKIVIDI